MTTEQKQKLAGHVLLGCYFARSRTIPEHEEQFKTMVNKAQVVYGIDRKFKQTVDLTTNAIIQDFFPDDKGSDAGDVTTTNKG